MSTMEHIPGNLPGPSTNGSNGFESRPEISANFSVLTNHERFHDLILSGHIKGSEIYTLIAELRDLGELDEEDISPDDVLEYLETRGVEVEDEEPVEENESQVRLAKYSTEHSSGTLDPVQLYMNSIARYPLLTASQEVELSKRAERYIPYRIRNIARSDIKNKKELETYKDGNKAFERMFNCNLRLVVSIAKKYQGNGVPFLDLIQEGNTGLNRAVEKFDWRRGYKFSTYATWWIRQAVQRSIATSPRLLGYPFMSTSGSKN